MLASRHVRYFWLRYVDPGPLERDPDFRDVLAEGSRLGLRVAGYFGVFCLGVYALGAGGVMLLTGAQAAEFLGVAAQALPRKLLLLGAAAGFLLLARLRPPTSAARAAVALYVLAVGAMIISEDLLRGGPRITTGWLLLLLLLAVGTVPFKPWQTLALGLGITALHTALTASVGVLPLGEFGPGTELRRFVLLVLAAVACFAIVSAQYAARHEQHRTTVRLGRVRVRLRERSTLLEAQAADLAARSAALEDSLARLEAAQERLVQQEKMASLGQLTAGVAHELKNPLNFVNNFAQLSVELVDDLRAELLARPTRPVAEAVAEADDLLTDLRLNAEKIREHGGRADGIIRSMLAHSRALPGPRRPAPLNRLLDEYVGLAYHGMRAEHQGFNVDIRRDYSAEVTDVEMVPEEMSRVFLNLLDNALAAVRVRAGWGEAGYVPALHVGTRPLPGGGAEVRIGDNGTGIPPRVRDRIFEPFFTTKPSGEGTGLGLSLAYGIVVRGHGGTLDVETATGEGTTFVVALPAERPEPPPAEPPPVRAAPQADPQPA